MATVYVVPTGAPTENVTFSVTVYAKAPSMREVVGHAIWEGFKDGLKMSWESLPMVQIYHVARHPLRTLDSLGYHFFAFTTCVMGVADCSSTQAKVDAAIGALSLIPFDRFVPVGELAPTVAAENEIRVAASSTRKNIELGGELYPTRQLELLKKYMEKEAHGKVEVLWGEEGAAWLDKHGRHDCDGIFAVMGSGERKLVYRGNPTRMTAEHEVIHYLDDRYLPFKEKAPQSLTQRSGYDPMTGKVKVGAGKFVGSSEFVKEKAVLDGLMQTRRWYRYNEAERAFAQDYVWNMWKPKF